MDKYTTRNCHKHGETTFVFEKSRNCYRCKDCRTANVTNFRRQRKLQCVEYLGGSCVSCGYDKCMASLDFHHTEPTSKNTELSKLFNKKWETVKKELDKCVILCRNCHGEMHEQEYQERLAESGLSHFPAKEARN